MENQNTEWKEAWHDEYLKWVCDFANTFFRSGQIEAWGRGIGKMRNGCVANNLLEPEFNIFLNIFSICFYIRNNNRTDGDSGDTGVSDENFGANGGVNEIKRKIVDLMIENPKVTAEQIANSMETTKRRVEYNISQLKKAGTVERIGADKNGYWVVNLKNRGKDEKARHALK